MSRSLDTALMPAEIADAEMTLIQAFALCNDVLKNAVQGISDLIIKPGIVNVDFADVKTIMAEAGPAIMGIGTAKGKNRAEEAAKKAISSPLLDISIDEAKGILFAVAGGNDLTLFEINEAAEIITAVAAPRAKIIFGAFRDDNISKGMIKITVIAAGFENEGLNIITKEQKGFDADTEIESNLNKDEDDKNIPAFLRKEESPSIIEETIVNRTLVHAPGDVRPKPYKFQPSRNNKKEKPQKRGIRYEKKKFRDHKAKHIRGLKNPDAKKGNKN